MILFNRVVAAAERLVTYVTSMIKAIIRADAHDSGANGTLMRIPLLAYADGLRADVTFMILAFILTLAQCLTAIIA